MDLNEGGMGLNGTIFSIVTMLLINVACLMPFKIVKWKIQIPTEATAIAGIVFPSPKIGKKAPSVDLIRTQ